MHLRTRDLISSTPLPLDEFDDPAAVPARYLRPQSHGFRCVNSGSTKTALLTSGRTSRRAQARTNIDAANSGALSVSIWFDRDPPIKANVQKRTVGASVSDVRNFESAFQKCPTIPP